MTPELRAAIVEYAKLFTQTPHDRLDCSHFVWKVFSRFFPNLPYVPSANYLSSPLFQRVTGAVQPADLIVWNGHVAIMINPATGSFIGSQTSTGVAITSFQNPYWNERKPIAYLTIA